MENPYAQSAGPAPATPEAQRIADYELAIGKNIDYYLPKFERFDAGGSKAGWNWPAFFVTTPWYLYRKMYLWGLLNLIVPYLLFTVVTIVLAVMKAPEAVIGLAVLASFVIPWLLLTVFANSLYWSRINKVIDNVPRSLADKPDKRMRRIEREGGTNIGAMIGIMFGVVFFGGGILAAISIPAYQDYTIRSQVMEGLNLASDAKAAVAEFYANGGAWPENAEAAGLGDISGKYVESVKVENGSIVIVYGGAANRNLAQKTLILVPGLTERKDIIWMCAERASPPEVVERAPGPYGTDIPRKYLPSSCRP